ncbi:MAG: hypothetical protein K0B84_01410 [Firmicutes bacterium]|nr:hypothetical protein [Bacillota bacterium]
MRLLFIFIDGVGLGYDEPGNPFIITETPNITRILEGGRLTSSSAGFVGSEASLLELDASLGISGLPQSATGQASIFTGFNAPAFLGEHVNGFPNSKLRKLLAARGVFRQLKKKGYKVCFANAYRPPFFELLRRGLPGERYSCSTLVAYYGGLPFFSLDDLKERKALFMDITNDILLRMGCDVPGITPEEGALRMLEISKDFDFCLFEYFLSDLAGHMGEAKEAVRVISILDRFIGTITKNLNPEEELLLVSSDHGNIEDLTTRNHTMNKVPALLVGDYWLRKELQPGLSCLTDLLPAVYKALEWKGENDAN